MWTCRNCSAQLELQDVNATLDAKGLNFICPLCHHRNVLLNMGTSDRLHVVQPNIDWDEFKAKE